MRVLGYVRLSRLTEATTSPERQAETIESWAKIHDHKIVDIVEDIGVSGSVSPWDREGLSPWLGSRRSSYDGIVGAKVDRISRRLMHFSQLLSWGTEHKKAIASASEPIDTSDKFGRMIAQILAMFAEFEREAIQERNIDSQQKALNEGRWHGGKVPYGYVAVKHPSGKGYILQIDPIAQSVLARIVQMCREKKSLREICFTLNEDGVPTPLDHHAILSGKAPKGRQWLPSALRTMLSSQTLLGITVTGGRILYDDEGHPIMRAEPAMDRGDWAFVQRRLAEITQKQTRTRRTNPLLGIAYCILCGTSLYRVTPDPTRPATYYRCRDLMKRGSGCEAKSIRAERLEPIIERLILGVLGHLEVMEDVFEAGEDHTEELEKAQAALDDLLEQSEGQPKAVREVYTRRIEIVSKRIAALAELPFVPSRTTKKGTGKSYREVWESSDSDLRRQLLLQSGIRLEAAGGLGDQISIGSFERPERYDSAVVLGNEAGIGYAFYLPRDLAQRATGANLTLQIEEAGVFTPSPVMIGS